MIPVKSQALHGPHSEYLRRKWCSRRTRQSLEVLRASWRLSILSVGYWGRGASAQGNHNGALTVLCINWLWRGPRERSPLGAPSCPCLSKALPYPGLQGKNNFLAPNNYWNYYALQTSFKSSHHPYTVFFHQPFLDLLQPSNHHISYLKISKIRNKSYMQWDLYNSKWQYFFVFK